MQYLVVTQDTLERRWQTELLLESLKLLDLPTVVINENNKALGCLKALREKALKQPFVLLDTDTFLVKPLPCYKGMNKYGKTYQFDSVPIKIFEDACTFAENTDVYYIAATVNSLELKEFDYETDVKHSKVAEYIVRYTEGYQPYFDSKFDGIGFSFDMPLPFKQILEAPVLNRPNVSLMQTLIRSWTNKNSSRIKDLMF